MAPVRRALVAGALALAVLLPSVPAAADPVADKRAEAERLAEQLEAGNTRISQLAERLDNAALRSTKLGEQVKTARGRLAEVEAANGAARQELTAQAIDVYSRGGMEIVHGGATVGDATAGLLREQYAQSLQARQVKALEDLRARTLELRATKARLEAAERAAGLAVAAVQQAQDEAAEVDAQNRALQSRVQGELAGLVSEAQERRAAADAERVRAQIASRTFRPPAVVEEEPEEPELRAAAPGPAPAPAPGPVAGPSGPTPPTTRAPKSTTTTTTAKAPAPAPPPPAPASGAQAAIAEARRQLGKPYKWGGSGPDSFDCSGLTSWAWRAGGKSLPHSSRAQHASTRRVDPAAAQPGDLFFFGSPIHHVGLYIGDGQMIEAPHSGAVVRIRTAYRRDLVGVGRP